MHISASARAVAGGEGEGEITRNDIEYAVATWIPKLGLISWDIQVVWPEDYSKWPENSEDPPDWGKYNNAFTWRARDYEEARVYFNPNLIEHWSFKRMHQLVVHELLHLVTREVEFILDMIDGQLHRDVDDVLSRAFHHHVEGAIDRLAYRIVEIAGVNEIVLPDAI